MSQVRQTGRQSIGGGVFIRQNASTLAERYTICWLNVSRNDATEGRGGLGTRPDAANALFRLCHGRFSLASQAGIQGMCAKPHLMRAAEFFGMEVDGKLFFQFLAVPVEQF